MRLLCLLLALAAGAASAQGPAGPTVHAVPFGSAGNALDLEVAGDGLEGGLEVAVASAPSWLRFSVDRAKTEASVARLSFDVLRGAPVGEPAEVVLEVVSGGAVVATHVVRLSVAAPAALALDPPRPNPTAGAVTVAYQVPAPGPVEVSVFDVLGRAVAALEDGDRDAGAFEAVLEAGALAPGVYVVRLVAGGEARVRSMTVVR